MADDKPSWQAFFASVKTALDFKIHPAGWPFVLVATVIACFALMLLGSFGLVFVALAVFVALFFRDPNRITPMGSGLVISPAEGKVVSIEQNVALPEELDSALDTTPSFTRVSIFLSVFNVHINRAPVDGSVVAIDYRAGAFLNAALDKASVENERSATLYRTTSKGKDVDLAMCQIAGWVARRIVNDLKPGQTVKAGQHMGLIRFGSRIDVYLPEGIAPLVCVGQCVIEGETILANLDAETQTAPVGEAR